MSNSKNRTAGSRFAFIRILALIAGFFCTGCQLINQNHAFHSSRDIASANLVMQISRELDGPEYAGIVSVIAAPCSTLTAQVCVVDKKVVGALHVNAQRNLCARQ